ncbi:MAG TPA: IclR family transcriptional regulator [Planctomycetota bacterium]|nr:IclR family transcriptional regulator [Planctomycetota bacterium]
MSEPLARGASPFLSIRKAFRILELLAGRPPCGVTEIAEQLGLEKSGVSRLLKGLAELGYVTPEARRGPYRVGPGVLRLAQDFLEGDPLVREAQPLLRELARTAHGSAHAAVLLRGDLVIVAKEPSPERIQVTTRVGGPTPLHASAMGKILLAALPPKELNRLLASPLARYTDRTLTDPRKLRKALEEIRRRGWSLESEEEHPGVGCIGAPVQDAQGRWIAALSVSGPLQGTPFRLDRAHVKTVTSAAAELSRRVGGTTA